MSKKDTAQADNALVESVESAETPDTGPKRASKVTGITKDAALKVLVENNPKRPGSSAYDRFEGYFKEGSGTVEGAIANGLTMGDLKYDCLHSYIEVEGAVVEEYDVTPRGPRGSKAHGDDDLSEGTGGDTLNSADENEALFG